jgi:Ca-activated chloride channel family protein
MRNWWQQKKFTSPPNHSRGISLALSEFFVGNQVLSKRTYLKGGRPVATMLDNGSNEYKAPLIPVNIIILLLVFASATSSRSLPPQTPQASNPPHPQESGVTVPSRPVTPLYKGEQGQQRSEIEFTPLSRTVTIKFHVEDPNGYFLPNIRRENFAVYEDGIRQKNVSVEIEHSPISVALLLELIGRDDKIAVFKYDAKLEPLADFDQGHEALDRIFDRLTTLNFSETNFYDALLETLNRMKGVRGRKAIILISSGIDTFSKANFQEVLQAARDSATPIYVIGLGSFMRLEAAVYGEAAPFARIDWAGAQKQLEMLANVSGGRAYVLESTSVIPGMYDDIMENLRLRYVVTYVSSNPATSGPPRNVQVELVDPTTGKPLKIRDSAGKIVSASVFVQQTYSPGGTSGN